MEIAEHNEDELPAPHTGALKPRRGRRPMTDPALLAAFEFAVKSGRPIDVAIMIDEFGGDPTHVNADGKSMLDLAADAEVRNVLFSALAERSVRAALSNANEPHESVTTPSAHNLGIL
jgi:hypothetical protein